MNAATVTAALPIIDKYFSHYSLAATYGPKEFSEIMTDTRMIRHRAKFRLASVMLVNLQTL